MHVLALRTSLDGTDQYQPRGLLGRPRAGSATLADQAVGQPRIYGRCVNRTPITCACAAPRFPVYGQMPPIRPPT